MKAILIVLALVSVLFCGCHRATIKENNFVSCDTLVKQSAFQRIVDGKKVDLFILRNKNGLVVKITNYGARIVSVLLPDKYGKYEDICLGYSSLDSYLKDKMYMGCIVGRYANRIAKGEFSLDAKKYTLSINNGRNSLHGGIKAFNTVVWDARQLGDSAIELNYISPDMEEGYPGKLSVTLTYTLTDGNELKMIYKATTDKKTIVNLSNHAYYNLHGEGNGNILNHIMEIFGMKTTPVDSTLIPTGELAKVKGTPFDFTSPHAIGAFIITNNEQLKFGKGYDHNWVLDKGEGKLGLAVRVSDTTSGRTLEIYTTEPGLQFYSGNFMDGSVTGKSGKLYNFRSAFVLEPQHFPDSPNHSNFPTVILNPGETYVQASIVKYYTTR